jgi:AhpD family alkylhydroperoxidase
MLREKYWDAAPDGIKILRNLHAYLAQGTLGPALLELVYLRVSQINGCAFCLDMHSQAARKAGVDQRKLDLLAAWREAGLFDAREQAALALAEEAVALGPHGVADAIYDQARAHFTARELTDLVLAIGAIGVWNRIAITFRAELPKRPDAVKAAS